MRDMTSFLKRWNSNVMITLSKLNKEREGVLGRERRKRGVEQGG